MAKKVLLCDDEIHILRAAEIKVSHAGYDVRVAHDGQEAWEMIQNDPPDVLVTDLQMPRCDGLKLTALIRGNERTRDMPILLLTAKGFETPCAELLEKWGVIDMLAKPFSPRELVSLIDKILAAAPAATQ